MNPTIKILLLALALLVPACKVCPDGSTHGWRETCDEGGDSCCKICESGQACGDTCIAWEDTCEVGAGCACQGAAVEDGQ